MAFKGKIFDNTPIGKNHARKRDEALNKCKENGHLMPEKYKRIKNRYSNELLWECLSCKMSLTMDFLDGIVKGPAMMYKCGGKPWL